MENLISFASMTHAMRARDLLRKHRISAELVRTPAKLRHGSCGYSLRIPRRFSEAAGLIKGNHYPYKEIAGSDAP